VWRNADPLSAGGWVDLGNAPWARRMWPGFCVHGDEMVISSGYNNVTGLSNFGDTWLSRDGITWREVVGAPYTTPRHYPMLVSLKGRLLLNNGNKNPSGSGVANDVWELS